MPQQVESLFSFALFTLIFFIAITIRYFIAAGVFYFYYYVLHSAKYSEKILSKKRAEKKQLKKEIFWSISSSMVFAIVGTLSFYLWQENATLIYTDIHSYPWVYLPISLLLAMFVHESYYYWVHRWMHRPKIFKLLHKVHHESLSPTPWTAFSFHPWESLLEAIILPFILMLIPLHPITIAIYLLLMTISSVINHLDIEIYPRAFLKKILIGASHHHLHHKEFKSNYGLYFTFWDRLMGTESESMNSIKSKKD